MAKSLLCVANMAYKPARAMAPPPMSRAITKTMMNTETLPRHMASTNDHVTSSNCSSTMLLKRSAGSAKIPEEELKKLNMTNTPSTLS